MNKEINIRNIPKSFIVLLIVFVVFIVLLTTLFIPTIRKIPEYSTNHANAVATIAQYEDTLTNQQSVQEKINQLTEDYNTKQGELFVDAKTSIEDLQAIFKQLGISMVSLNRGDGVADSQGRTSTGGIPLYTTNLNFSYNGSVTVTNQLIHYLEQESKGCYFINNVSMTPTDSSDYSVSFQVTLYYFDATKTVPTEATQPSTAQ